MFKPGWYIAGYSGLHNYFISEKGYFINFTNTLSKAFIDSWDGVKSGDFKRYSGGDTILNRILLSHLFKYGWESTKNDHILEEM